MSALRLERMWKFLYLFLLSPQLLTNILQRDGYVDVTTEGNNSVRTSYNNVVVYSMVSSSTDNRNPAKTGTISGECDVKM
jgi:hypothetical protein